MKKINLLILTVLFMLPFAVKAAEEPKVLTVKTEVDKTTIKYEGTTEDGVYAVMCKLFNSNKEEIDMLSSAVDNKKFNGTFTVPKKGEYKVVCANYDGGKIKETTIKVTEEVKEKINPKTYDSGIIEYVILISVAVVGIAGTLIYKKMKKQIKY